MPPSTYKIQYGDTLSDLAQKNKTTVADLMKANPDITDPNKIYTGRTLNIPGATPVVTTTPVTSTTVTPTVPTNTPQATPNIASLYGTDTTPDTGIGAYYQGQAEQPLNEQEIRDRKMREIQAEIDAQNQIYAEKLKQARVAGQGRLGETTAIQARRGLIGSDFGASQTEATRQLNTGIEADIEAQRNAAVQSIMTKARDNAVAEIEARKQAKEEGYKNYIDYLKSSGERKVSNTKKLVGLMFANNQDPSLLDSASITEIAKGYGITPQDVINEYKSQVYANQQTAEAERKALLAKKPETMETAQGIMQYDPSTGTWKNTGFTKYEKPVAGRADTGMTPIVDQTTANNSIDRALQAVNDATKYADASGIPNPITRLWRWSTGSEAQSNLVAQANTLRTLLLTLRTDPNTKKFFGPSMSNADVQLMMSGGTTLNPELQSPEELKAELDRVKKALTAMKVTGSNQPLTPQNNISKQITDAGGVLQKNGLYLMPDGSLVDPTQ